LNFIPLWVGQIFLLQNLHFRHPWRSCLGERIFLSYFDR
jgi:hypothetical protein